MNRQAAIEEARRLVVREGWTYAQAADATGIPASTLQKRGSAEEWGKQKGVETSYRDTIRRLKSGLLDQALKAIEDGGDATQIVHAWRSAETAFPEHRYDQKADPKALLGAQVDTVRRLVEYLGEHDRNACAALEPHVEAFVAELAGAAGG